MEHINPQPAQSSSTAKGNRRAGESPSHWAQSLLLLTSTGLAAFFCYLYITKPVVEMYPGTSRATAPPTTAKAKAQDPPKPEPAKTPSTQATAKAPIHAGLEETNIRIQHILTAETAGGRSDRIELTVPVLYRSRYMRWSDQEVDTARQLMERLVRYQEQSRALRAEGQDLLAAWNRLVGSSLPTEALRADSPSLPSNQKDANDAPRPSGWTSTELIRIQAPEK